MKIYPHVSLKLTLRQPPAALNGIEYFHQQLLCSVQYFGSRQGDGKSSTTETHSTDLLGFSYMSSSCESQSQPWLTLASSTLPSWTPQMLGNFPIAAVGSVCSFPLFCGSFFFIFFLFHLELDHYQKPLLWNWLESDQWPVYTAS